MSVYITGIVLLALPVIIMTGFAIGIYLGFRPPHTVEEGTPSDRGYVFEEVSVPTVGGKKLFGWFLPARTVAAEKAPTLVVTHGWGGNAEYALEMMEPFLGSDTNVLLFDVRSHGKSDPAFVTSLRSFAEDTGAAVDWVRAHVYEHAAGSPSISLVGHSMGGAAVLYTASQRTDIHMVISLSTFAHLDWLLCCLLKSFHVAESHIPWVIRIIEWVTGGDLDEYAPQNTINRGNCPVLVMHGTADEVLPFSQFEQIRAHCSNPCAIFIAVEGAPHYAVEHVHKHYRIIKRFLAGEKAGDGVGETGDLAPGSALAGSGLSAVLSAGKTG